MRDLTVTGVQTCALPISRSRFPIVPGGIGNGDGRKGRNRKERSGSANARERGEKSGKYGKYAHFLPALGTCHRMMAASSSWQALPRFNIANFILLCHKPQLHRPADQGLPCRCPCRLFHFGNNPALSTL